jgi:GTP cyclohydrolase II
MHASPSFKTTSSTLQYFEYGGRSYKCSFESKIYLTEDNNTDLAQTIAAKLEENDDRRKKIWEKITMHAIKIKDYKLYLTTNPSAMKLSKEGNIKIEHVLDMLPDFLTINDIKTDLLNALEEYNLTLQQLGKNLDDTSLNSDLIRKEINSLNSRQFSIN